MTKEYTGGSVSYYRVYVANPTKISAPYEAECNDIIEALNMNYAEGNAFKAIWRKCAAELGKAKQGYIDGLYDAEKVEFFGTRMVAQAKQSASEQCGQLEAETVDGPCPYDWKDAPEDYNWLATDREGAFWYRDEPEMDVGGTLWVYPFRDNIKVINEDRHDMVKYQRPQ
jgi:hypothetical protein